MMYGQGVTGHALGAAGGFEAVTCVKALETGTVPPTINYVTPDPECDLDYTPNKVCVSSLLREMKDDYDGI